MPSSVLIAPGIGESPCPLRKAIDLGPWAVSSGCCRRAEGTLVTLFAVLDLQRGAHQLLVFSHPSAHIPSWGALPRLDLFPSPLRCHVAFPSAFRPPTPSPGLQRCPVAGPPHAGAVCPRTAGLLLLTTPGFSEKHHWTLKTQRPASGHHSQGLGGVCEGEELRSCGLP